MYAHCPASAFALVSDLDLLPFFLLMMFCYSYLCIAAVCTVCSDGLIAPNCADNFPGVCFEVAASEGFSVVFVAAGVAATVLLVLLVLILVLRRGRPAAVKPEVHDPIEFWWALEEDVVCSVACLIPLVSPRGLVGQWSVGCIHPCRRLYLWNGLPRSLLPAPSCRSIGILMALQA